MVFTLTSRLLDEHLAACSLFGWRQLRTARKFYRLQLKFRRQGTLELWMPGDVGEKFRLFFWKYFLRSREHEHNLFLPQASLTRNL